ncbi:Hsp90 co-chaperone Cdc37 [Zancudomyces culisetae]|uniref:Hsp90 chaperone protein kinase-targeting subunit n=1 Tax=Zancudomyces culisetae TaxID=1213189 RepID=A0A1R1PKZ1_ZANCU|nr:Hsp90 co-chaperone Cdc37 [Zancudomyces culisetae]|eukprot:OMH81542.1 Hsp90 co-chaperone Cdc37 [Zancudomyces culisetae]
MVLDYSKWDNLEISDDSDVEIHPNIEKGTFIRLRQQKIRQDRENRAAEINNLQTEIKLNRDLMAQISALRAGIEAETTQEFSDRLLDWMAVIERQTKFLKRREDEAKRGIPPAVPTVDEMMDGLILRVQEELVASGKARAEISEKQAETVKLFAKHLENLKNRESEANKRIESIQKEQRLHISADDVSKEGFSKTIITKSDKEKKTVKTKTVEVLNPHVLEISEAQDEIKKSTKENVEIIKNEPEDEEEILELSAINKKFAELKTMSQSQDFILSNIQIINEKNSDQIFAHAFQLQMEGKHSLAKQYVKQALIITYILKMGSYGTKVFFSKVEQAGSPAHNLFYGDLEQKYNHITERCKVIQAEQAEEDVVESIQLQTDNPDNQIRIFIPDENVEEQAEQYKLYKSLPEGFQQALRVGTIDEINKSLATMSGKQAEDVLAICGEGGFLVIDEEILV